MNLLIPFFMDMPEMKPIYLFLVFLTLSVAPPSIAHRQFSCSGFSNTNLTLDGAASVTPNGLLELTNGTAGGMGHALYPTPLCFRNLSDGAALSFSVSFVFAIVSTYKDLSGNGLTLFIAPSKNSSAAAMPMQYLGNQTNHIFAVELDTWQNLEFQDMNGNHIGIDINSLQSIQSHDAGFYKNGTFQSLSLDEQEVMQVWVDYQRQDADRRHDGSSWHGQT